MQTGHYSLCLVTLDPPGAAVTYRQLAAGYASATAAFRDRARVAADTGFPVADCVVVREVDVMEAELFTA